MVTSTVWRSSVELTACPTSPSACSSATDRESSSVRAATLLLEVAMRLLELRRGAVELVAERLELVAGAHVDTMREVAGADPRRACRSLRIGATMPRASSTLARIASSEARGRGSRAAQDRRLQRRERLGERLLDEHDPARRDDRRVRGEHLARRRRRSPPMTIGVVSARRARSASAARTCGRRGRGRAPSRTCADVGVGDQPAAAHRRRRRTRRCPP